MKKTQYIYEGYNSYQHIKDIVENIGAKKIMVVCDSSFDKFHNKQIDGLILTSVVYIKISSNPEHNDILKGVDLFIKEKCDFIISIGGGSVIDAAKCINIQNAGCDNWLLQPDDVRCMHLAIPTTAGTGSESTQFAVIYKDGKKISVEHPNILPDFVILDSIFLKTLPLYQKKSTMLDALCQSIESIWAKNSTLESKKYARKAIRIILENVEAYLLGDFESMYLMLKAANLSGKAINESKTTAAHAMSYKLSSIYGIAHGHAVALCLPYVWENLLDEKSNCLDTQRAAFLSDAFNELTLAICAKTHYDTFGAIMGLFVKLEIYHEFKYSEEKIRELVSSVNMERLNNHPVEIPESVLHDIYVKVLNNKFYSKKNKYLNLWNGVQNEAIKNRNVKKLQLIELNILLAIDRICKDNHITYYLGEGTLLGAVLYNGFIPGDDNVKILMQREDYERFNSIAQSQLPYDMILQNYKITKDYFSVNANVRMENGIKCLQQNDESSLKYKEPCVDILPLDYVPKKINPIQNFTLIKVKLYHYMLLYKTKDMDKPKNIKKLSAYYLKYFFSKKFLIKNIDKLIQKFNQKSSKIFIINYFGYKSDKQIFYNSIYGKPILLEFENNLLPVPANYVTILKSICGNYIKLPLASQRLLNRKFE